MNEEVPATMRFGCLVEKGKTEVRTRPLPELEEYDVLLKVRACNICTVDYQQFMGLREHQGYPMAGGHECCGEIVKMGGKVKDFQIGDRVAVGYKGCGHCPACRSGHPSYCREIRATSEDGYTFAEFGFADYTVKPIRCLYKIDKRLDPSEAAFVEPLSTVIDGLKQVGLRPFETVVIIGAGPMGLLNALTARAYGAHVVVTELLDEKIQTARAMGFETVDAKKADPVVKVKELTAGAGADAVVAAVANTKAYEQGLRMLKDRDGRFLMFAAGYPAPALPIDANAVHYKKMQIIGAYGSDNDSFEQAAKALNSGQIQVSRLIEAKYPLDDMQAAFQKAVDGNYRVSIVF